jgi:hypothetical protein
MILGYFEFICFLATFGQVSNERWYARLPPQRRDRRVHLHSATKNTPGHPPCRHRRRLLTKTSVLLPSVQPHRQSHRIYPSFGLRLAFSPPPHRTCLNSTTEVHSWCGPHYPVHVVSRPQELPRLEKCLPFRLSSRDSARQHRFSNARPTAHHVCVSRRGVLDITFSKTVRISSRGGALDATSSNGTQENEYWSFSWLRERL